MVTQSVIELLLPAIDGTRLETVQAAEFVDRRARLPLLEDGKLLFRGNPAAAIAFNRWSLVHLHKDNQAFQTVQISTGADHAEAITMLHARNESIRQPQLNLQITRAYLAGTDSGVATRTWQQALDAIVEIKSGSTQDRWRRAAKET